MFIDSNCFVFSEERDLQESRKYEEKARSKVKKRERDRDREREREKERERI